MPDKDRNNETITIEATFVKETAKALLLDCEGDQEWFPKSKVEYDKETEDLTLPRWLFKLKFPDEEID